MKKGYFILGISLLIAGSAFAANKAEPQIKVWTVYAKDMRAGREYLWRKGIPIIAVNHRKHLIEVGSPTSMTLESAQSKLPKDLFFVAAEKEFATDVDQDFHDVNEVDSFLSEAVSKFPHLAKLVTIGKTTQGRPILGVLITNPDKKQIKPHVVFNGAHHAREVMAPEVPLDTVQTLLENYGKDQFITSAIDNLYIWVIPQVNPDGRNMVFKDGKDMWRKNAWKDNRGSLWGVDLNRNYSFGFNTCGGSSGSPSSDTFRGPTAASEPETQAMQAFYDNTKPLLSISYHSYSELVVFPMGCPGQKPEAIDQKVIEGIGKDLASVIVRDDGGKGYDPGYGYDLLYPVDGSDTDYHYGRLGTISYVIELNSTDQGFQPSYKKWRDSTVKRLRPAWTSMLRRAMTGPGLVLQFNPKQGMKAKDIEVLILEQKFKNGESPRAVDDDFGYFKILPPGNYTVQITTPAGTQTQKVTVNSQQWTKINVNL